MAVAEVFSVFFPQVKDGWPSSLILRIECVPQIYNIHEYIMNSSLCIFSEVAMSEGLAHVACGIAHVANAWSLRSECKVSSVASEPIIHAVSSVLDFRRAFFMWEWGNCWRPSAWGQPCVIGRRPPELHP